jgi:hypothetical protein
MQVSAKLPPDEAQNTPATLWAQLWYSDLLVSCLPVLLYATAPALPTDMRALVEINAWAGCAYQEQLECIQAAGKPEADPGSQLANTSVSSGNTTLINGSCNGEDLLARGMADLHAAFPSQSGAQAVVQLQQPHPILGFQSQELTLCLQPTTAPAAPPVPQPFPTSSSAGPAAATVSAQYPQQVLGHECNLSEDAHASSLVSFLTDLGIWRTYASRGHDAAQAPLSYAASEPLPSDEASEGNQPAPLSHSISGYFPSSSSGGQGLGGLEVQDGVGWGRKGPRRMHRWSQIVAVSVLVAVAGKQVVLPRCY